MGQIALDRLIREHPFIKGLSEEQMSCLTALATEISFEEGALILKNGRRSEWLYLLLSGSVAIEVRAPQFTVCVQALGPGQAFGWSALLDNQDTCFQVRAREPVSALRFEGGELAALCRADGRLGTELLLRILRLAASRVIATEARFAEMCGVRLESAAD